MKGPTSAEVVATDVEGMLREGRGARQDRRPHRRQGPFTRAGVRRARRGGGRHRVNVTLIFSPTQALRRQGWRQLRQPLRRPADDIATSGMNRITRLSRFSTTTTSSPIAGRVDAPSAPYRRSGADWGGHLHLPGGDHRCVFKHPLTDIGLETSERTGRRRRRQGRSIGQVKHLGTSSGGAEEGGGRSDCAGITRRGSSPRARAHRPAVDVGTFQEIDKLGRIGCATSGWPIRSFPATASLAGQAVEGRAVYAFAPDFTVFGGHCRDQCAKTSRSWIGP